MHLRSLYLNNFRIFEEILFEFDPKINLIYGSNARGKTSVLEAIFFLITGRSFRTARIQDLIRKGASAFYIEAHFVKCGIDQRLRIWCDGKERKITYNNTLCASSASLLGLLQGVVITPEDVVLVKGSPHHRRQFLDLQIAQVDPLYVHHLMRFSRAMQQRNSLLRAKKTSSIESWEIEMAKGAAYVVLHRRHVIKDLCGLVKRHHLALTGDQRELGLAYKGNVMTEEVAQFTSSYLQFLQKNRQREMVLGTTLHGPHKDDLAILIGDSEARFFASEGEQRGCVTALYLSVWERMHHFTNDSPLMLIDDAGISLDTSRREKLFQHLSHLDQVFLSTTQEIEIQGRQFKL